MASDELLPVVVKRRPPIKSIIFSAIYFLVLIGLLLIFCPWTISLAVAVISLVVGFIIVLGVIFFTSFSLIFLLPLALIVLFVVIMVAVLPFEILGALF